MSADDFGRLSYLVVLGGVLLLYLLIANRNSLGTVVRQAMLWGLIFLGVVAGVGLWQDVRDTVVPTRAVSFGEGYIEVPRAEDGHYYLTLSIAGEPVRFVVDTGATDMVLSRRDAERLGIDPDSLAFTGRARTANGLVRTARVALDHVALGGFVDNDVTAWINEGEMDLSLLGMGYLSRFDRIEIERGRLVLTR